MLEVTDLSPRALSGVFRAGDIDCGALLLGMLVTQGVQLGLFIAIPAHAHQAELVLKLQVCFCAVLCVSKPAWHFHGHGTCAAQAESLRQPSHTELQTAARLWAFTLFFLANLYAFSFFSCLIALARVSVLVASKMVRAAVLASSWS